jgi:HK97 family phage portal protein
LKILGWQVPFTSKADSNTVTPIRAPLQIPSRWGWITEAFGGMFQTNTRIDNTQDVLSFSPVYACVSLISGDIAKLRLILERRQGAVWAEFENPAYSPVLRRPNRYQTKFQFIEQWLLCKLIYGNVYVFKERDARNVVTALYILDPSRVQVNIAPDGEVFYKLNEDWLAGIGVQLPMAPASEVIHDRAKPLFHPLVGVPPLYASALSGSQGRKIQTQSSTFFENMARPSGHLSAEGHIDDATLESMKRQFQDAFSGVNTGRLLVTGGGIKFASMSVPAQQAQLIEQLGWTVEDVARAFLVPLYKIAAAKDVKVDPAVTQEYYNTVLHPYIQAIEDLLKEGLALANDVRVRVDVDELLRMDPKARMEKNQLGVRGSILAPNEARLTENLPPVKGGEQPLAQHQDYPLAVIADRKLVDEVAPSPSAAKAANDDEVPDEVAERGINNHRKALA